jgi:hypothetical protein
MLQSILSHTPTYVWAILAFLIYRGVAASADRELPLNRIFIVPLAMLALSLHGIGSGFGLHGAAPWFWLCGALLGAALSWQLIDARSITPQPRQGTIDERGSWLPLALMLSIFGTKYVVAVCLSVQPERAREVLFMGVVCGLFGLFNGLFIGKLLRSVSAYQQAARSLAMA